MDNLTHTLIGFVAGEAMARCTTVRPGGLVDPIRRNALLTMGMVGGNLPDIDLLWSLEVFTGDRVAYLVEHRGYTHTLVGCVALALLLFLSALAAMRWRRHMIHSPDVRLLGFMALLSVTLHMGMDSLNEYGVHPFWPWDDTWYYGDTLFIIEPLLWLATAPLLFVLRRRTARTLLGIVLAIGCMAVLVFHQFGVGWWALPAFVMFLLLVARRLSPRAATIFSGVLICSVIGAFSVARGVAFERVEASAAVQFPGAKTLDVVLAPAPAHPFCWDVILLQSLQNEYVARLGQLSLDATSSGACARTLRASGTAPLVPVQVPVDSGMRWTYEFSMKVDHLARLAASNCDTRRAASFLRAPFASKTSEGWIIGDLRYDREPGTGFAEVEINSSVAAHCPKSIPWVAPRRDLGF